MRESGGEVVVVVVLLSFLPPSEPEKNSFSTKPLRIFWLVCLTVLFELLLGLISAVSFPLVWYVKRPSSSSSSSSSSLLKKLDFPR